MNTNRLAQLQAFLKESPGDPFLQYAIAYEHLKSGGDQQALQLFVQLTKDHPDYVGTYYHLGKLQEKMGNSENALVTYKKGMQVANNAADRHAFNELQQALNALNDELMEW